MGSIQPADELRVLGSIRQTQGPPWKLDGMVYEVIAEDGTWYLVVGKHWDEGSSWPWHDCPAANARYWTAADEIVAMQCGYCGEFMSEQIITLWKLYSAPRIGEWLKQASSRERIEVETV